MHRIITCKKYMGLNTCEHFFSMLTYSLSTCGLLLLLLLCEVGVGGWGEWAGQPVQVGHHSYGRQLQVNRLLLTLRVVQVGEETLTGAVVLTTLRVRLPSKVQQFSTGAKTYWY